MSSHFDGQAAAGYLDGPPRQVPGYWGLLRMTTMLLAERLPDQGRVLVVGAGGGLEIRAMAESHAGWSFHGVDPSAPMLALAGTTLQAHASRVTLQQGYVADAPDGPFDGATSILVLHFVPRERRLATLQAVRQRLRPGAPFVLAHISFPQAEPERSAWIARHVAFGMPDGTPAAQMESARHAIATRLSVLAPEEDEALLRAAGFTGVTLFYAGLSLRGWVAYAGS